MLTPIPCNLFRVLLFSLSVFLRRASKLVIKGAVEGAHRGKSAFKRAISGAVFSLVHKHYGVFKPDYSEIFYKGDIEARLEIARNIALAVTEVRRYLCGSDTAFEVFVYVEE